MPISATDLNKAYLAYFGRPADLTGKTYFATLEQADVIKAFDASAESKALYGNDAAAKVNAIYNNLFNRDAEPAGLVYWTTLINQGRVTPAGAAFSILNGALGTDATAVSNKLAASAAFVTAMDTTSELVGYSGMDAAASARNWLKAVGSDAASLTAAVAGAQAAVTAAVAAGTGEGGAGFQLTNGTDVASANVFTANQVYTPGGNDRINSLQDEDRLTGTGTNATLNATLGNAGDNGGTMITPTLVNVNTINAAFTGSGGTAVNILDLQDATGVNAVNITRISDANVTVTVQNITSAASQLSVKNSQSPNNNVNFTFLGSAVAGTADSTTLTVNNVNTGTLRVEQNAAAPTEGFETINLVSSGSANAVRVLQAEDLRTLNISGTQNLSIGNATPIVRAGTTQDEALDRVAGFNNVAGSFTTLDASGLQASLVVNLGNEVTARTDATSGGLVNFAFTGTANNDVVRLLNGTDSNGDSINGGDGRDTLQVLASVATGTFTGLEVLDIRGQANAPQTIAANLARFTGLEEIMIRNEGNNGAGVGANQALTVNLTGANATQYAGIQLQHGVTTNNGVADLTVNATLTTNTTADTAGVTWADQLDGEARGINQDARFNFTLGAAQAENVTLRDNDSESNSVHLSQHSTGLPVAGRVDTTLTINGGAVGQFISTDSFGAAGNQAAGANAGYGHNTDSALLGGDSTTVLAAAVGFGGVVGANRDTDVARVLVGTTGIAGVGGAIGDANRLIFQTIDAATYAGNVELRLGDVTRADGVSSQRITTAAGNDTFIFDAIGSTSAGFTSGDTIAAGAGTDTLVIDGNTATIPGTPRINHQASEWDNLTGIDVLRFGNNAGVANSNGTVSGGGAYYSRIDNEFIAQTDAGNRLTIINNDGDLSRNTESDLELDLRGLSQNMWVTFVGADANGAAVGVISSNRLVLDDTSANQNMVLNGGDSDISALLRSGNNNTYEVRNTANVSISDLSQTSNFGTINFTNDQATVQTLTLTLNNTVVSNLVDSSWTATQASAEVLNIVATDGAAAAVLNVDARQVTGFHALNVTGSVVGNDVVTMTSNVGGTASTIDLLGGAADRVNFVGGAATDTVAITLGAAGTAAFNNTAGTALTTHKVRNVEYVDLTGLAATATAVTGSAANETIVGGAGADVITGGAGRDVLSGGLGNDTFVFAAGVTDTVAAAASSAGVDLLNDLVLNAGAADRIDLTAVVANVGTTVTGAVNEAAFIADLNTLLNVAGGAGFNTAVLGTITAAVVVANAGTNSGKSYLVVDLDGSDTFTAADFVVEITGSTVTSLTTATFI